MTTPFSVTDILTPWSSSTLSYLDPRSHHTLELLDCPTGGYGGGHRYPPTPHAAYGHVTHDMASYDSRGMAAAAAHASYGNAAASHAAASWYNPAVSGASPFACECGDWYH